MPHKDPEVRRQYFRDYQKKNKLRLRKHRREWYLRNKTERLEYAKNYAPRRNQLRREHYQNDIEYRNKQKANIRNWEKKNRRKIALKIRLRVKEMREELIDRLGGRCADCGYDENTRALQLDHKAGDGKLDRQIFGNQRKPYYSKVLDNVEPV